MLVKMMMVVVIMDPKCVVIIYTVYSRIKCKIDFKQFGSEQKDFPDLPANITK